MFGEVKNGMQRGGGAYLCFLYMLSRSGQGQLYLVLCVTLNCKYTFGQKWPVYIYRSYGLRIVRGNEQSSPCKLFQDYCNIHYAYYT